MSALTRSLDVVQILTLTNVDHRSTSFGVPAPLNVYLNALPIADLGVGPVERMQLADRAGLRWAGPSRARPRLGDVKREWRAIFLFVRACVCWLPAMAWSQDTIVGYLMECLLGVVVARFADRRRHRLACPGRCSLRVAFQRSLPCLDAVGSTWVGTASFHANHVFGSSSLCSVAAFVPESLLSLSLVALWLCSISSLPESVTARFLAALYGVSSRNDVCRRYCCSRRVGWNQEPRGTNRRRDSGGPREKLISAFILRPSCGRI